MLCTFATRGALEPWSGGVPAAASIRNHMHSSVMLFWRHWLHEGIMTWKFSLHCWPFVRGIHTMTRNAVLWWISWWTNNPIQCWWSETPWSSCDTTVVMMTSSNGNIFRVPGEFPAQLEGQWRGALMLYLICIWINGTRSKQWWGWWFETPSRPFWRHCNGIRNHSSVL